MSQKVSPALLAHYQSPLQTITRCIRIERQDGQVLGFTEHDRDLVFENILYRSAAGMTSTAVQCSDQLSVNTVEIEGLLVAAGVERAAIRAGLFDQARIELFEVNYADLIQGKLSLLSGSWGETHDQGRRYVTEFRSLAQALQQPLGELYSATCRAQLGDHRCQVNLEAFTHPSQVMEVISSTQFLAVSCAQPAHYFEHGLLTWQTGHNKSSTVEIKDFQEGGFFELVESPTDAIEIGDTFLAIAGCDKRRVTCQAIFNNVVNFRGEPFVPSQDQALRYPDVKE